MIDLKFGHGELHQELISWQLRAYAAMILQVCPSAEVAEVYVYHVPTGIEYQGQVARADEPKVTAAIAGVIQQVNTSKGGTPTPHPAACLYCKAKSICPALQGEVEGLMKTNTQTAMMPQLVRCLEFATIVGPWCDAIRKKAREMIHNGEVIPGWKIKSRRNRAVTDVLGARDAVHGVLDEADFMEALEVRLTRLEELYIAAAKMPTATAKRQLEAALREHDAYEEKEIQMLTRDGGDNGQ